MDYSTLHDRVMHRLDRLAAEKLGPGAKTRLQDALEVSPSFLSDVRRQKSRIPLDKLTHALEILEVHPAEFFYEALREHSMAALPEATGAQDELSQHTDPEVVPELEDVLVAARSLVAGDQASSSAFENLRGYWAYRALDRLRMDDPRVVLRMVLPAFSRVDRRLVPWVLGAYGSALRRLSLLRQAFTVGMEGVVLAQALGDRRAEASLHQRLAHIFCDVGDCETAIEYSQQAGWLYCEVDDRVGQGRTYVDLGKWYFNLDRYSDTIRCHRRALALLPKSEANNRFAAYLGHAYCYEQLGELGLAETWSGLAEALIGRVSPAMVATFLWHRGKLAVRRGFHETAVDRFREAYDFYVERDFPLYGAACAIELCEALTLSQRPGEAQQVAANSMKLLPRLNNDCAKSVVLTLAEYAAADRPITLRLLADLRRQIEESSP